MKDILSSDPLSDLFFHDFEFSFAECSLLITAQLVSFDAVHHLLPSGSERISGSHAEVVPDADDHAHGGSFAPHQISILDNRSCISWTFIRAADPYHG